MPSWPGSLPQFVLEQGYDETLPDQSIESQMETGPAKARRRFTTNVTKFQVQVAMDQTQASTFETFYSDTLEGGTLTFDWVHPITRVAKTFRFRKPVPKKRAVMAGNVIIYSLTLETLT